LWYGQPAERWLEALPVGNGRLGAMIYGGIQIERIALSESTAWSGAPATGEVNPGALKHLNEIRQLFFAGKYDEAQVLCGKHLPGHAKNFGTNLPLPELQLAFDGIARPVEYRRSLSLEEAITRVRFRTGKMVFQRETFASHPDHVLAIRLTCSEPGQVSFHMKFSEGIVPATVKTSGNDTLQLDGHAWEHMHSTGHDGVALQIRSRVITERGRITSGQQTVEVREADAATVLVAIGTSFRGGDADKLCRAAIENAVQKTFVAPSFPSCRLPAALSPHDARSGPKLFCNSQPADRCTSKGLGEWSG
jgi:alpha-L-fucosidase 2